MGRVLHGLLPFRSPTPVQAGRRALVSAKLQQFSEGKSHPPWQGRGTIPGPEFRRREIEAVNELKSVRLTSWPH